MERVALVKAHATRRLPALLRRRPIIGDVALVAALLAIGLPRVGDLPISDQSRAFTLALVLPLLWRRRRPMAVFCVVSAIAAVQWLLDVRAFGDVALLVALFTVALTAPVRVTLLAAAVVELGVILAAVRWAPGDGLKTFVGLTGLATAAGVMGTSMRNRRALVASLEERAQRLELERDQQGRLSAAAERARIAREMHDIVAHNLSVMVALADGATYALAREPGRAEHAMLTVSRTGRQALTEMRRLLGVLTPAARRRSSPRSPGSHSSRTSSRTSAPPACRSPTRWSAGPRHRWRAVWSSRRSASSRRR